MEFNIREVAYELYKQDWIDSHTTGENRLNVLKEYFKYRKECIENNDEIDSFDEWIFENGYPLIGVYACYEEFCDEEYLDSDYMYELLNDADLIRMYDDDVQEY